MSLVSIYVKHILMLKSNNEYITNIGGNTIVLNNFNSEFSNYCYIIL